MASNAVDKARKKNTVNMLEQAKEFLVGEPNVWSKTVGEDVTGGEQFGQMLKAGLPFSKGAMRPDLLVFHELPTKIAKVIGLFTYSRHVLLPIEYMALLDGRIPYAAVLKRGRMSTGIWESAHGNERDKQDKFCHFLSQIKKGRFSSFAFAAKWDQSIGRQKIKLQWTMQLIPVSPDQYIFLLKQPFAGGLFSVDYGIKKMMELAPWLKTEIDGYNYQGEPAKAEMLAATHAALAIPKLLGQVTA